MTAGKADQAGVRDRMLAHVQAGEVRWRRTINGKTHVRIWRTATDSRPPTNAERAALYALIKQGRVEVIYDLIRDRHGTLIGHTLAGGEIFHGCGPGPGCSLIDWLENTEETLEGPALVTPRVPIEVAWRGEYYSWRAA
jgi:hypothetical protein